VSAYHAGMQTAVFGGGNSPSNAFFRITPAGVVQRIDDVPTSLMPISAGSDPTMIVDAGLSDAFVVLFDRDDRPAPAPFNTIWLLKPNAPSGQQWVQSQDTLPSYMTTWSGFRTSNCCGIPHLGLVMWMRASLGRSDTAVDLKERFSSVFFYKPSGV
jgi:hypothetical protein